MSNRRFGMFEIRPVLVRMRQGDSGRVLAKAGIIGHRLAAILQYTDFSAGCVNRFRPNPLSSSICACRGRPG